VNEGIFFGHIDTVLGHPRKTMAKVAKDTVISFLSLEDLDEIQLKYPKDWSVVVDLAGHHRDRQSQIFSNHLILKRPAKLLWSRAMTKLIMLSRWSHFKKDQNHQWLEKLNNLTSSLDEESMEKQEAAEALEVLFQCKEKLVKCIVEHQKQQEELVAATQTTLGLSPGRSPLLGKLSPKFSPRFSPQAQKTPDSEAKAKLPQKTVGFATRTDESTNPTFILSPPPIITVEEIPDGKQEEKK